ncbi:hypothetical protein AUJ95_08630 [Candidatus Desantisbacteria bacterium CG2_30_40_21]|uniref:Dipeptidylpeptidase IV N-terminal domain-containing protein n=4 Tax=unclassified Candidatus Desantisiibacteriota TaxID=3106372 RepID=A0A2M7J9U6_9BACT|nr:MAG: hypothetical protein AUJ95_08630 [Candidatus Desantisbacteria bacterium CG2_30_40_21]PIP40492.1 MAG: hypothetical protein COX18_06550 [Candidatus Desantisbacteria bacterium CG23_combo_of_CG06-09_8_20_14_all_40_23]PIX16178.1 MAG: hypothetical protein COZ71_08405 [Candidatus Desantisbacteria bacterium CG_4_8_14_3_um_filter_40_12]PIY19050.1 MAG: hypothetical protein COZ13_07355 [Candidatus Desantisbacteria bacterium CG_4_10_14_3_um_filter_40_18]
MEKFKKFRMFLIAIVIIGCSGCKEKIRLLHPILPSTEIIFVRCKPFAEWSLWGMDRDGKNQIKLIAKPKPIRNPSWSPDGNKIMFVCGYGDAYGDEYAHIPSEIWIIDTATMKTNKISVEKKYKISGDVCWFSSGEQILFTTGTCRRETYIVDISGKNLTKLPIPYKNNESRRSIVCSPIEDTIIICALRGEGWKIYITDSKGRKIERLTEASSSTSEISPCISLDGEWVAFDNSEKGYHKIILISLKTKKRYEISPFSKHLYLSRSMCFSPDEKKLIFEYDIPEVYKNDLYTIDINGKNLKNLTNTPDWDESSLSWRPIVKVGRRGES